MKKYMGNKKEVLLFYLLMIAVIGWFVVAETVFIIFGFRFMFYSNDHTPIHIHVIKDGCEAKYNIEPVELVFNHGFKRHDLSLIESIVLENKEIIIDRWRSYFNK